MPDPRSEPLRPTSTACHAPSTGLGPDPASSGPNRGRRQFIGASAAVAGGALAGLAATAAPAEGSEPHATDDADVPTEPAAETAAEPRPFDASLEAGDIEAAARVAELELTPGEIEQLLPELQQRRASIRAARGDLPGEDLAPATSFRPAPLAGARADDSIRRRALPSGTRDPGPRPESDTDVAFAPLVDQQVWMRRGELTSVELVEIYLGRIERHDPALEAIVTVTADLARQQARKADAERAGGIDRGMLHGIPYGAKDLFDTDGIATTWGATPYADRVGARDAAVITRLRDAGAVLIAKTTLGALAYGDIWHEGRTNNPWNVEQGSSGSSAGSASGTAAGLFSFSLGTETYGSIVSPCMRCGTTGIRPTFGRVARTGAMALCWTLDKIGPIARTVEDAAMVLAAIDGADAGDPSSFDLSFEYAGASSLARLRVGYDPRWFDGRGASDTDRAALDAMRRIAASDDGPELVEIEGPDATGAGAMLPILEAEAAAAFQALTLSGADDTMKWQAPAAWPNTFRAAHFHSAVDLVQADRRRRRISDRVEAAFAGPKLDAMLSPSFAGGLLLMTNFSGHPCAVVRAGIDRGRPRGVTLWGRLGGDDRLARLAAALEGELGVAGARPTAFDD